MSSEVQAPPTAETARVQSKGRSVAVWIVLVLAGLLLLLSSFAVWVNRVALNTDVFTETSTELIEDDAIRQAVATRAVDELFLAVDVEAELEERLPADYKRLAGPARAGLREGAYTIVDRAFERPRLQRLWALTVEQSHRTLVRVLEGDEGTVSTTGGVVSLDLEPIILDAADRIGLREQVQENLPASVGRIEILRSDELDTAQDAFSLLKATAWFLPLLTLVAFGAAAWLSVDRRRVVRRIGITIAVVGLVGLVAVNIVGDYVVDSLVADTETRTAAGNAWDIVSHLLRVSFRWFVVLGVVFVLASWLAGPGARAVAARRFVAPVVRERPWAYAALGLLGVILLLTGAVGDFTRFLTVAVLMALGVVWIEAMRKQTIIEHPDASAAALFEDARAQLSQWWEQVREQSAARQRAGQAPPTPTQAADLTSRLASLADLHERGALTDEEYAAAKARVLAGE
jgi:Short C-terminal domain